MKGYVESSKGLWVSERKLRRLLPSIAPIAHHSRQTSSYEWRNPSVYIARYFGHKLHLDQNEKLVNYGVTYVLARDGYSGKVVGSTVMPRKNNHLVYENVYRKAILEYGLWDQVRVDHGREFYLVLYIHERLRLAGRGHPQISPYVQTTSTNNHIIERIWVELNHRVTYPVKQVIVSMDDQGTIDMSCTVTKFAVSTVLCRVCEVGMNRMVAAWNSHPIPRRGIPNQLQDQEYNTCMIHQSEVPDGASAVQQYRQQGGQITDPSALSSDPIGDDQSLFQEREVRWLRECGMGVSDIFSQLVSGTSLPLENSVLSFIRITNELAP